MAENRRECGGLKRFAAFLRRTSVAPMSLLDLTLPILASGRSEGSSYERDPIYSGRPYLSLSEKRGVGSPKGQSAAWVILKKDLFVKKALRMGTLDGFTRLPTS